MVKIVVRIQAMVRKKKKKFLSNQKKNPQQKGSSEEFPRTVCTPEYPVQHVKEKASCPKVSTVVQEYHGVDVQPVEYDTFR